MVSYPTLSSQQQSGLPELIKPATELPALFDDSTHTLWHCETTDGVKILKLCNHDNIKSSSFWRGMNLLFDAQFPDALGHIEHTYKLLSTYSPLEIAQPSAYQAAVFVLTDYLFADDVDESMVSDVMVAKLAEHLAALHQLQQPNWGALHQAHFVGKDWPIRLQKTLTQLIETYSGTIPDAYVERAIQQAERCTAQSFLPMMIDLRWDQFLHRQGQLFAIVDIDAFAYAPVEVELVMLEYLLDQSQAEVFSQNYTQHHPLPDLTKVRHSYRLLLFLMNVLGETDVDVWMNAPTRF